MGKFSALVQFAKGEVDNLYGLPRQSVLAFFIGLLAGALIMGTSSFNATERAYLRCMRADPRIKDNRDCSISLSVANKELAEATGRVQQLSDRCGLCNSCQSLAKEEVGKAEAVWLKEKQMINQAQTEALRGMEDAQARANEVDVQCSDRISAAAGAVTKRAEEDAEVHREEAALKASRTEEELQVVADQALKSRDAAEQDRDAARQEHEECLGRLQSASDAHLSTNRTHAEAKSELQMALVAVKVSANECESRHMDTQTSLCYVCKTCGASVGDLPACSQCRGRG